MFFVRVKAVSLLPAMSGQREHVFTARRNSCVLYPFWGNITIGKVHCNVRIVLFIEMSEDLSNTDHSTWELCFGSSLNTYCPAARCSHCAQHPRLAEGPALLHHPIPAPWGLAGHWECTRGEDSKGHREVGVSGRFVSRKLSCWLCSATLRCLSAHLVAALLVLL